MLPAKGDLKLSATATAPCLSASRRVSLHSTTAVIKTENILIQTTTPLPQIRCAYLYEFISRYSIPLH